MKKNPVQTFLSLRTNLKTHEIFTPISPSLYSSEFKTQTYVLAYHLMTLWTCKPPEEDYHYLFMVHQGRFYHQGMIHEDIYQCPTNNIRLSFKIKDAMHLGKMTLFHLILAIDFKPENLVILQKPHSDTLYFSLKARAFWSDFFYPEKDSIHFFSRHGSEEKIQVLIDNEHLWWKTSLSGVNVRKLFLREMFEVFFRVYLTPWPVIEALTIALIGQENPHFLEYLKDKFTALKDRFEDFLTEEEQTLWQNFIRFEGNVQLECFLKDFDDFLGWLRFMNGHVQLKTKANIIERAMHLNIFGIEKFCHPLYIKLFSAQNQNLYLNYIINLIKKQPSLFQQANHQSWLLLNSVCSHLSPYQPIIEVPHTDEIKHIICKALQFNHTSIVCFFIRRNPLFAHAINQYDTNDSIHYQRSLLFSALVLKHADMVNLLKGYSITLNTEDRIALKAFIFYCVDHQLPETFVFILKNQYEILYHLDENQILFRTTLENHCQAHAPAFLTLIPKISIRPMRFLESSSSSSDSSDVDSPLTTYQKRYSNEDDDDLPLAIHLRK